MGQALATLLGDRASSAPFAECSRKVVTDGAPELPSYMGNRFLSGNIGEGFFIAGVDARRPLKKPHGLSQIQAATPSRSSVHPDPRTPT
jgi:hypothetical protein